MRALEFDSSEVAELAEHVLAEPLQPDEVDALFRSSAGQPALLTLLLRHLILGDCGVADALVRAPRDVMTQLERIVTADTRSDVLDVLGVAAVLGSGEVSELVAVSHTSPRIRVFGC